jgi:hypothetical protein
MRADVSSLAKIAAAATAALFLGSAASAAHGEALQFRDQAAEINSASRLVSAYGLVTSTFRTIAHNRSVGGVPNSYHLLDRAIDIARRPGVSHQQIDAALRRAGYNLVESLDELDHSHFAFAAVRAPASVTAPANASPAPAPKPLPRVAADEHGTLAIDLQAQSGASVAAAATPR